MDIREDHTLELSCSVSVTFSSAGRRSCSVPTATEEEEEAAKTVKGEEKVVRGESKGPKR